MKNFRIHYALICTLAVLLLGAKYSGDTPTVDHSTGARTTITYPHHEIHAGSAFVVSEANTLGDGNTREYLLETANTAKWPHLIITISGSLDTAFILYEDTTKTTGTAVTELNRDRNSIKTAGMVVTHTPAGAGNGTPIYTERFGTDSGPAGKGGAGGGGRGIHEFILQQNTKYLIIITSHSAANNVTTLFDWYEHTNH